MQTLPKTVLSKKVSRAAVNVAPRRSDPTGRHFRSYAGQLWFKVEGFRPWSGDDGLGQPLFCGGVCEIFAKDQIGVLRHIDAQPGRELVRGLSQFALKIGHVDPPGIHDFAGVER